MSPAVLRQTTLGFVAAVVLAHAASADTIGARSEPPARINQALEWNQIFIDTLIATNTANSSSPRLGAIVHTAVFDAYNGIDRRYTPILVQSRAPRGASRRAAVTAAAYTALVGLFPSQQAALDARYAASLAALSERCTSSRQSDRVRVVCDERIQRGIEWGAEVARAVLAWRADDGFGASYPAFTGGTAIGQWRPTPPAFGPMSAGPGVHRDVRAGEQRSVPA